ncbi:amidinotransferase [bacterium]|nr:MAG: amidinotransferase [bacterium]
MVDPIKKILLNHPKNAFFNQKKIDSEFKELNFFDAPDYNESLHEYEAFIDILKSHNIEMYFLDRKNTNTIDSIYAHDPFIISNDGAIICNMGKKNRVSEIENIKIFLKNNDIPILGEISAPGKLEGGDIVWIDKHNIAVGIGYRSNIEGAKQLGEILSGIVKNVISVPLPHWNGPSDCLHLMSNLSPIDSNLFLVYSRLLPVQFIQYLEESKIELIEVPFEEYETMACNVLAIAPREIIMLEGNPITKKLLEKQNVIVHTYKGSEISLKGSGGPTCLTKPLLRSLPSD